MFSYLGHCLHITVYHLGNCLKAQIQMRPFRKLLYLSSWLTVSQIVLQHWFGAFYDLALVCSSCACARGRACTWLIRCTVLSMVSHCSTDAGSTNMPRYAAMLQQRGGEGGCWQSNTNVNQAFFKIGKLSVHSLQLEDPHLTLGWVTLNLNICLCCYWSLKV